MIICLTYIDQVDDAILSLQVPEKWCKQQGILNALACYQRRIEGNAVYF